jgi:Domain of unknown function (DUF4399)
MKLWQLSTVILFAVFLDGCGNKPQPPVAAPSPPASTAASPPAAALPRMPSPAGAKVTILSPANGEKLKSPVTVKFGIEGMTLAPAGSNDPNSGHHHLLIDAALPETIGGPTGEPIPKDGRHQHFGKAQTEAQIDLPSGEHTLQLLLGDGNHVPHNPAVYSQQVLITVE